MFAKLKEWWRAGNSSQGQMGVKELKIVVGLGNPGKEYAGTRHNVGFKVIGLLADELRIELSKKKFGAVLGTGEFGGKKLILLKPWRFMNLSGQVVADAVGFYKLALSDLLVISDDMALDVGKIRVRAKGSSGGQKGLLDIIEKLGTDEFGRVRVGIGASGQIELHDYVLSRPGKEEAELIDQAAKRAKDAVLSWLENGIEAAMNEYN